jgi:hypothetical protein
MREWPVRASLLADSLVRRKLAAAEREVAMASDKPIEVVLIRITAAGRRSIGGG